jgi:hypothetical protein
MHFSPKKLGITQLSLDLFVLAHKFTQKTFCNSPSIPLSTDLEYQIQWESPGGLR